MDRDWIDDVKIEHRGENGGMNITVFARPPHPANLDQQKYYALVSLATNVFYDAVDPDHRRFEAMNAEVMIWSDEGHQGTMIPHRYRVTVDFDLKGGHENA